MYCDKKETIFYHENILKFNKKEKLKKKEKNLVIYVNYELKMNLHKFVREKIDEK